jgi:hypothetical protein
LGIPQISDGVGTVGRRLGRTHHGETAEGGTGTRIRRLPRSAQHVRPALLVVPYERYPMWALAIGWAVVVLPFGAFVAMFIIGKREKASTAPEVPVATETEELGLNT